MSRKIGILGSRLSDGSEPLSWYRAITPFTDIRKNGFDIINIRFPYSHAELMQCDIIYAHKPTQAIALEVAERCKDLGIKLWFDYDDNIFAVPADHPMSEMYQSPKLYLAIMSFADVITVSTDALAKVIAEIGPAVSCVVTKNYLPQPFCDPVPFKQRNIPVVGWRGGRSHYRDLIAITSVLNDIAEAGHKVHMWGINSDNIKEKRHHGRMPPFHYIKSLREINPNVMINFWERTVFNESKSDAIWLEAMSAGAVLVTNEHEVFNDLANVYSLENVISAGKFYPEYKHVDLRGICMARRLKWEQVAWLLAGEAREITGRDSDGYREFVQHGAHKAGKTGPEVPETKTFKTTNG